MGAGHHHGHHHGHAHGGHAHDGHAHHSGPGHEERGAAVRRALLLSLALNAGFLVVEAVAGWWSGSLALLSDAAHMLSDVGALLLAYGASQLARVSATAARSYGFRRAEPLGAFVNGLTLLVACGWILFEAVERLRLGAPAVAGRTVLIVGVLGLLINLGSAWALARSDRGNLNVRAALVHMLADALGSAGAIAAAIFILLGYPIADPLISLGIAALVLWGTWHLLRESTSVLLQFAPAGLDLQNVRAAMLEVDGVLGVHDLHVWTLDGQRAILSAHVQIGTAEEMDPVRRGAVARLAELGVHHVTLQLECEGCDGGNCEGDSEHAA